MCDSDPSATPGATWRFGPMKDSGEARSENCGSVSTLRPPTCARTVAWPIQVTAGCMAARAAPFDAMNARSGATCGMGVCGGRGRPSRAASKRQRSKAPMPLGSNAR